MILNGYYLKFTKSKCSNFGYCIRIVYTYLDLFKVIPKCKFLFFIDRKKYCKLLRGIKCKKEIPFSRNAGMYYMNT